MKAANEAIETVQKASQAIDAIQKAGSVSEGLANSDAKISVSVGASKSVSTSHTEQTTHQGSELSAGTVTVRATEGDNTIAGSKINATRTELEGTNVNLLGTTDTQTNRSDNKSSSWNVGVFLGKSGEAKGFGVEGGVSVGKGYANSDSKVQNHTEINSDSLSIKTKETTTVKGAVANINHLVLDTKNLHIESVQDTESYNSKQTQGGINGAVALIGEEASASAQFSQTKANVDYAQVAQQSGFNIRESSQINVEENTHLKGGVINAEGDKANHQLTTGTLTTESIENRSDVKVSSVSVGVSSDMSKMATSSMSAALSALGNMRESERSQTQAAISSNINLTIADNEKQKALTGKTAEETLQSLNRDTQNANQAVEKADLSAIQEKQETVQVIGELSQSWTNRLVQPHLEEAGKKRQEAEKLEKSDPLKSAQLKAEAQAIEAKYGLGSNLQLGIRAATAALQGLATGNANAAAVGLLSPYVNKLIKEQTTNADGTVNTEANLIAHSVLGAIEAYATGNNAAAGALGAFTAEAAAPYLMQAMYGTDKAAELTEGQKQNIVNLSQIAAGLASGLTGNSTADFISGAEIGKRAVENNYLTASQIKSWLNAYDKANSEEQEAELILNLDKVDKIQKEQALETRITKEQLGKEEAALRALLEDPTCLERCQSLAVYSINQLQHLQQDYDGLLEDKAINAGVGFAAGYGALGAGKVALKVPAVQNYLGSLPYKDKFVGAGLAMGANAGYQQYKDGEIKASDVFWAGGSAFASSGTSFIKMNLINAGSATTKAYLDGEDPIIAGRASIIASSVGYAGGKIIESGSSRILNRDYHKDKTQFNYVPVQHSTHPYISTYRKLSPVPSVFGNVGDNILSGVTEDKAKVLLEQYKNKKDDK